MELNRYTASRKEIAKRFGVSLNTLDAWLHRSDYPLPCVRAGRKVLISISAADAWFEAEAARTVEGRR